MVTGIFQWEILMSIKPQKIVAVTGARSEYDLMYSVYKMLDEDARFDFSIIITGPHLSENFGYTSQYIENDGFRVLDYIYSFLDSNHKLARVSSIGNQIPLLAQSLNREKPDLVIVAGDREEAISVTMTCAYMDIPCAHFFGGDIAKDGNIDNSVRYAASKFAHLHFVTLEEHKKTLLKLGEEEWRIHVIGNPGLDRFLATEEINKSEVLAHFQLHTNTNYAVLIQHSIITEVEDQPTHIRITLDALLETDLVYFVNFPNTDSGSMAIIEAYNEYVDRYPEKFVLFKNLERNMYINLLRNAAFLIGNSSSGLLEAPSLGLPAVNVGSRQRGRIHGDNVLFVDNNKKQILSAIQKILLDKEFVNKVAKRINPYGDGAASIKTVEILSQIELNNNLVYKNITYK